VELSADGPQKAKLVAGDVYVVSETKVQ